MTPVEIIFAAVGGAAALIAVLGWLAKSLVTYLLDKDVQKYKSLLESEKDAELQKLRHELERVASEHKIRFGRLHERRDEVIATLYSRIVEFYNAIDRFIDFAMLLDKKHLNEEELKLWKAVDAFKDYAEKHRIYFSEEICKRLDRLYEAADQPTGMLMMAVENPDNSGNRDNVFEAWRKAKANLADEVQKIRKEIEIDFRELLGVIDEPNNK